MKVPAEVLLPSIEFCTSVTNLYITNYRIGYCEAISWSRGHSFSYIFTQGQIQYFSSEKNLTSQKKKKKKGEMERELGRQYLFCISDWYDRNQS